MYLKAKNAFLTLFKVSGITPAIKYQNRNKIPILCYHGISKSDEHLFMPSNFMQFNVFKQRMEWLKNNGYTFIHLNEAIELTKQNKVDKKYVVITIDDGFSACFDEMIPYIIENKIKSTFYITTYYARKNYPIFRIAMQYIMWKHKKDLKLESLNFINDEYFKNKIISVKDPSSLWDFINHCEKKYSSEDKNKILNAIEKENSVKLNEDNIKSFSIYPLEKLAQTSNDIIDYQLHTHTHRCDPNPELFHKDLSKNKALLKSINNKELIHFCYPSGIWDEFFFTTLNTLEIKTATTCDPGLVDSTAHPFKLPRFIDTNHMTLNQFEAEITGVGCFLRKIKRTFA